MGNPLRVKVIGSLVPYVAGFRAELEAQGYRPNAVCDQLRVMAHVSRWLVSRGLDVGDLTADRVEEFLVARRAVGYRLWCSPKGVAPLLAHLRRRGVVPMPEPVAATTPTDELLERYRAYLVQERGLAAGTVAGDLHVARLFLATRPQMPGLGLWGLTASEVIDFALQQCRHRSTGSAKYVIAGLRALLRFCYLEGSTAGPLAEAVPRVASWRGAALPSALDPADVAALLASCDRRTRFGRRDFAVLTLLVRLGFRAGEVAGCVWMTSTGELESSSSGAKGQGTSGCRCPPTWVRRSPAAAPRPAVLWGPRGLHPGPSAAPGTQPWWCLRDRARRVPMCRSGRGARPPAAPHRGDSDAARRGRPGRDRPGATAPQRADDLHLCQGRPLLAPGARQALAGR